MGQRLGLRAYFALGHDVLAQADAQGFVGVHPAAGQDQVHRAAFTHQARQAHGAAVDQRNAPTTAAVRYRSDAWRVVYVTEMMGHLWVIHAFQKKSKTGIKTPKAEIDLVRTRLGRLKRERQS